MKSCAFCIAMSARRTANVNPELATTENVGVDLGEGSNYNGANINNPYQRNVCFAIQATLAELASSKKKSICSPPSTLFHQTQFTDLVGASEAKGDLSSTILHSVSAVNVKSTFPLSVGVDLTGVDAKTFSSTGRPFSTIVMPNFESHTSRELQKDDPAVAYAFAEKYPSYNASNLETNGVHLVPSKNFALVATDHPVIAAIGDNKDQLQNADFVTMKEGFVKMSTSLYNAVLPVVKAQVASQVRVRDFSNVSFQISPAEHSSWGACLEAETINVTKPLKTERHRALAAISSSLSNDEKMEKIEALNQEYDSLERMKVADLQSKVVHIGAEINYVYNHLVSTPKENTCFPNE